MLVPLLLQAALSVAWPLRAGVVVESSIARFRLVVSPGESTTWRGLGPVGFGRFCSARGPQFALGLAPCLATSRFRCDCVPGLGFARRRCASWGFVDPAFVRAGVSLYPGR